MCDCFGICINKIPFLCQPYLLQIIAPKTFYFRYATFPPAYRHIKGLYFPVSMNKCQRTYIPLCVYVKHCNHRIAAGNISRIKILHVLIVFHVHIIRNTYKPLFAQPLYHIFSLLFRKTPGVGILRFRICNFNLLIKLHALLRCRHCLILQILFFFCCQDTDRFRFLSYGSFGRIWGFFHKTFYWFIFFYSFCTFDYNRRFPHFLCVPFRISFPQSNTAYYNNDCH